MKRLFKISYMTTIYLFLYVPIITLIIYSFNKSKYSTVWRGFSFKWYEKLFHNELLLDTVFNSLTIAFLSASLATIIGTLAAIAFYKYKFTGKKVLYSLVYILMMSPDIVMGISLLSFFMLIKLKVGFLTLLLSHITFNIPFVIITVYARISDFDKHIIEASNDLGANEFNTFRYVLLPMLLPSVIAGWMLSFTLSLDDVIISFFVTGPNFEILPLKIYSMVRLGVKPEINALCTFLVVITFLVVFVSNILLKEKKI